MTFIATPSSPPPPRNRAAALGGGTQGTPKVHLAGDAREPPRFGHPPMSSPVQPRGVRGAGRAEVQAAGCWGAGSTRGAGYWGAGCRVLTVQRWVQDQAAKQAEPQDSSWSHPALSLQEKGGSGPGGQRPAEHPLPAPGPTAPLPTPAPTTPALPQHPPLHHPPGYPLPHHLPPHSLPWHPPPQHPLPQHPPSTCGSTVELILAGAGHSHPDTFIGWAVGVRRVAPLWGAPTQLAAGSKGHAPALWLWAPEWAQTHGEPKSRHSPMAGPPEWAQFHDRDPRVGIATRQGPPTQPPLTSAPSGTPVWEWMCLWSPWVLADSATWDPMAEPLILGPPQHPKQQVPLA